MDWASIHRRCPVPHGRRLSRGTWESFHFNTTRYIPALHALLGLESIHLSTMSSPQSGFAILNPDTPLVFLPPVSGAQTTAARYILAVMVGVRNFATFSTPTFISFRSIGLVLGCLYEYPRRGPNLSKAKVQDPRCRLFHGPVSLV